MSIAPRTITRGVLALALVLAGVAIFVAWRGNRAFADPHTLLEYFPVEDATVISINVAQLRGAGFLPATTTAPEAEYKQFLDGTGFNYRRDLDTVVASFSKTGNYFIAKGRFDWHRLRDYATSHGGSCYNDLCHLIGSVPERHISFLPIRNDVLALAVSTDDFAATRLTNPGAPLTARLPDAPAWISVPGTALRAPDSLPAGLRITLSGLANSDRVIVTFNASSAGAKALEAHMEALCRTDDDARILQSQLRSATSLLKEAAARDSKTANDELAGMLLAGTFNQAGKSVTGVWPIPKDMLDSLTNGL